MVIRRYISRWKLLFSGNKKVYFEVGVTLITTKGNTHLEIYLLITTKEYISRWKLLFSGNKKVYFEVEITL